MITVRDICSTCEHLWNEHREDAPVRFDSIPQLNGKPCGCCVRMAVKVRELNKRQLSEVTIKLNSDDMAEYEELLRLEEQLDSYQKLCNLRHQTSQKLKNYTSFRPVVEDTGKRNDMIEVGKVDKISVYLDEAYINLDGRALTPKQAIEIAQILMKAAECQTEYAVAAKDLDEQKNHLDAKYKDMISGLGLENPDLKSKDLAKQNGRG